MASIHEYDEKIENLCSMMESTMDEESRTNMKRTIVSLYKEQYDEIIKKEKELQVAYENGDVTDDEYDQMAVYLQEKEAEAEPIACPYMTEAAHAIELALAKTELKELTGREGQRIISNTKPNVADKTWVRRRLAVFAKANPSIIPVKKLKAVKMSKATTNASARRNRDNDGGIEEGMRYQTTNGHVIFEMHFRKQDEGTDNGNFVPINECAKTKEGLAYYLLYMRYFKDKEKSISPEFAKKQFSVLTEFWKKQNKKTEKEITESVFEVADQNHGSIELCGALIDYAVSEGVIGENIGECYKEFAEKTYEKETLLQSLERF